MTWVLVHVVLFFTLSGPSLDRLRRFGLSLFVPVCESIVAFLGSYFSGCQIYVYRLLSYYIFSGWGSNYVVDRSGFEQDCINIHKWRMSNVSR